ncbi:ABC transporter permease [Aeromicrobium fastidiosum]|uniref:ABC transporter permease n=1 Tax=Aeromicrobium fastidiosum TaxID=52699 RepID=A0A641AM67_9ACTN|nr:ABC transporter permease [Aeromicrobium fastidiosum]KAA1376368.1 ABC transporter permease [Aeromicrobium fastidiosum]MBP2391731.1 putative ABC transport system permease protein [Aeromicrobium fastidiosum]
MSTLDPARSAAAVAVLLAIALLTVTVAGVRVRADAVVAVARGAVQLVVVALVIAFVFRHPGWVVLYLGVMVVAATATSARRIGCDARDWGEVEGWLALGATPRQATAALGRVAAGRALIPAIDQTRSAGLVTLPGAFVGLLLGGASPAEAAEVQLLVLVGLLAAEAVAAVLTARLLGGWVGTTRPEPGTTAAG